MGCTVRTFEAGTRLHPQTFSVIMPNMALCVVAPTTSSEFKRMTLDLHNIASKYHDLVIGVDSWQPIKDLYENTLHGSVDRVYAKNHLNTLKELWDITEDKTYKFSVHTINTHRAIGTNLLLLSFTNIADLIRVRKFADSVNIKNCFISMQKMSDENAMSKMFVAPDRCPNTVNYALFYNEVERLELLSEFYRKFMGYNQ